MRLLVDMNLTPRWVHFLQDAGYEVVDWSSVGPNSA
jgi:predicted nuclease of predicted toxin-antitoxin system